MKRIGLLGGMSFESSIAYERLINEQVRRRLGGTASADLVIRSYNFAEIEALQESDQWDEAGALLASDALQLERFGADVIALCTNTMHKVAPQIEETISVPFVHIVDATAGAIAAAGLHNAGLLGTAYTMEDPFYRNRLATHGITTAIPGPDDRIDVHRIIFEELVQGVVTTESKLTYLDVTDRLVNGGAEGIIAGCTEIELLVQPEDLAVPYFPSTQLHVNAIVEAAFGG